MKVASPITGNFSCRKVDEVNVKDIIKLYKDELNYDPGVYFKGLEKIDIYECVETAYRFYYPFHVEGDAKFYEDLQRLKVDSGGDYYRHWEFDHRFAFEKIHSDAWVLEIGCGVGSFLEKILPKTKNVFGLELNREAVRICQNKNLNVTGELIQQHAKTHPNLYDVVCAFQVLEHVTEVKSFLEACVECLKPGGKLIIGVPNNEPYYQRFNKYATLNLPPHHVGLWNINSFKKLERFYPIIVKDYGYEAPGRWHVDAYLQAKKWTGIKTPIERHTWLEKMRMLALAPVSVPKSLLRKFTKGINGGYIVVEFQKKIIG